MLKKYAAFLGAIFLMLSACTQTQPKKSAPAAPKAPPNEGTLPKIDHIVVVVEENHSQKSIKGNPEAPYINSLMNKGANLLNYHAIEHPSQPNYLDLFSGSNQGVMDDHVPADRFAAANLGSELLDKDLTFTGYSEDLPHTGFNGESNGKYARKHNPWVNFTNIPKDANQPLENFPADFHQLPTVSFVIPNLNHDMHDGSIRQGDQWLKTHIEPYVQWAEEHNSLLIVTWDEDDFSQNNKIPTFLAGPMVKPGQYTYNLNHFNMLRTIEEIYGLGHAGASVAAIPIMNIWK